MSVKPCKLVKEDKETYKKRTGMSCQLGGHRFGLVLDNSPLFQGLSVTIFLLLLINNLQSLHLQACLRIIHKRCIFLLRATLYSVCMCA